MDTISIKTNINDLTLLHRINRIDNKYIRAESDLSHGSRWLLSETCAQAGAVHIRFMMQLACHVFLAKIQNFTCAPQEMIDGSCRIYGEIINNSARAFLSSIKIIQNSTILCQGNFYFATTEYNETFKENILQPHYQRYFSCLNIDVKNS